MTRLRSNTAPTSLGRSSVQPTGRPRSNAMVPTRERSNAVDYGQASYMTSSQGRLLEELRQQGIRRGIQFLGAMDVNWEALAWDAAGEALNTGMGIASPTFGIGPQDSDDPRFGGVGVQDLVADKATEMIGEFFKKILEKAKQKLRENVWVERAMRLMGLGIDVLMAVVSR